MASWQQFALAVPEMATQGRELLGLGKEFGDFEGGLAYLGTMRADGGPRIHPISPVLHNGTLYAFVLRASPKCADLQRDPRYALHSWPRILPTGTFNDDEFYIAGRAILVQDEAIRRAVAEGCGDDVQLGEVFALDLERVLLKVRAPGKPLYSTWRDEGEP